MKKLLLIIMSIALVIGSTACKRITYTEFVDKMRIPFDAGVIDDEMYKNIEIGIEFPLPDPEKYINTVKHYDDSLPNPPRGYKYAAQSTLFTSWYSEDIPYIRLSAYYQKYPDAKKYKTHVDLMKKFRDEAISYSVSEYRGEWKDKYSLTDIQSTTAGNIDYSYYTAHHVDTNRYFYIVMFTQKDYYFAAIIYGDGTYPEESSINEIVSGIVLYD